MPGERRRAVALVVLRGGQWDAPCRVRGRRVLPLPHDAAQLEVVAACGAWGDLGRYGEIWGGRRRLRGGLRGLARGEGGWGAREATLVCTVVSFDRGEIGS